ncbi:MAG: hypothetical protein ACM3X9_06435 [Bacillota bacterium]
MDEEQELKKGIVIVEDAEALFSMMALKINDPRAREMYRDLCADMDRHLKYLRDRQNFLQQKKV